VSAVSCGGQLDDVCGYWSNTGSGDVASAVEAIDYAVAHGAQVINISWGTTGNSIALKDAIQRAVRRNVVVVCFSWNDGQDISQAPTIPHHLISRASYQSPARTTLIVLPSGRIGDRFQWPRLASTYCTTKMGGRLLEHFGHVGIRATSHWHRRPDEKRRWFHSIPRRLSIYCQPRQTSGCVIRKVTREESLMPALLSQVPTADHKTPLHRSNTRLWHRGPNSRSIGMVFRSQIARMIHAERMAKKESESRPAKGVNLRHLRKICRTYQITKDEKSPANISSFAPRHAQTMMCGDCDASVGEVLGGKRILKSYGSRSTARTDLNRTRVGYE